ncbi:MULTISPECIES: B12-binding domain-containing radical SAM protein [Psychrobacillus]|uniref:B12-binding domain-containing radical SAM protein n=1 Tax=Psychrobacillus faecigallinarum TaxID=2762235 RepID=A0ABR8R574_9BACI|nr:B12-binding domain-containing radical SAM protein [Psychrobacillus faecigallinarum]MBD7942919.1 B12-binding domain-containing radical SAM protein [Psychrobacillus faecigallinarum]
MNIILTTLNAKFIHTNLALRCLKAYAEPEYSPLIVEYTIKDPTFNIVADLYQKKPSIVGFSCYIWNIEETIKVIKMLKTVDPSITIILGGPEVSYDTNVWLRQVKEIDYIVVGEGEQAFKETLDFLSDKKDVKDVPGLAYVQNDKFILNPLPPKLDLRESPSPYRFEEDLAYLSKRIVYIETSRGCPFSCQFCLSSIEVGVRYFNREKVKEDIRYLMQNGAKTIKFVDRTFNISRSYAMEMFQFLIDEHLPGVVFQFEITADIMRPEVIQFLNDNAPAGLFRFEIGVQSTNDLTNELVKRRQNFEKLKRTVTMVKSGGKIDQHLDLIAGLPEEDYTSFRRTFNEVFEMRPEELQLGFLKLLRGTGLRVEAEKYGYVYVDQAPYEIFSNNVLSFNDILRIKQVEDVLEKYWNAHRMDQTLEFLFNHIFETPFDFFQQFGTFWEDRNWSRIGHQLEDLYTRLFDFLGNLEGIPLNTVKSVMKLDYLSKQKFQPRKPWWENDMSKEEQSAIYKLLLESPSIAGEEFAQMDLTEREIYKQTFITPISIDMNLFKQGVIKEEQGFLLTTFHKGNTPHFSYIQKNNNLADFIL